LVEDEGLEAKEPVKPVIREDGNGIVCQIQELFTGNKILNVTSKRGVRRRKAPDI
jgi:hypothetical protein